MLFNSIFRNVNVTILCVTDALTMLYAACREKRSFYSGGGGLVSFAALIRVVALRDDPNNGCEGD